PRQLPEEKLGTAAFDLGDLFRHRPREHIEPRAAAVAAGRKANEADPFGDDLVAGQSDAEREVTVRSALGEPRDVVQLHGRPSRARRKLSTQSAGQTVLHATPSSGAATNASNASAKGRGSITPNSARRGARDSGRRRANPPRAAMTRAN